MNLKNKDIISFNLSPNISVYGKVVDTKFLPPFGEKGEQILIEVLASNPPSPPSTLTLCWGVYDYKRSPRMAGLLEKVDSNWRSKLYVYTNIGEVKLVTRKKVLINQLNLNYNGL